MSQATFCINIFNEKSEGEFSLIYGKVHLGQNKEEFKEEIERRKSMRELSKQSDEMRLRGGVLIAYFAWKLLGASDLEVEKEDGFLKRITGQVLEFHRKREVMRETCNSCLGVFDPPIFEEMERYRKNGSWKKWVSNHLVEKESISWLAYAKEIRSGC